MWESNDNQELKDNNTERKVSGKLREKTRKRRPRKSITQATAAEEQPALQLPPRQGSLSQQTPSHTLQTVLQPTNTVLQPTETAGEPLHTLPQLMQLVQKLHPLSGGDQTVKTAPQLPTSQPLQASMQLQEAAHQTQPTVSQSSQMLMQSQITASQPLQVSMRPLNTTPQLTHTVSHSSQTILQPTQSLLQPPQSLLQASQASLQPPQTLFQLPQTVLQIAPQTLQTVLQAPNNTLRAPQPAGQQLPHSGPLESTPSLASLAQFTLPPNLFPSPLLNSAIQAPLQPCVLSSHTSPHSSTMSMLSALQDDKLALILPVLVRMEHKIDQIMAIIGAKSSVGINGLQTENKYNPNLIDNQCESGPNSVMTGNGSIESKTESHSTTVTMVNQLNTDNLANHSNIPLPGKQKKCFTKGDQAVSAPIKSQSKESQSTASTTNYKRSNVNLTESHSSDGAMENSDTDTAMESISVEASSLTSSCNVTNLHPGLSTAQGRLIQRKMAKITELTLPENSNFPISRDNIIAMQAKSTSTMNFAVRLMRELFTLEELDGKNISGARGKDRVDPNRVEIIKEIVFQVYRTLPSDRDMVWRCCRKAMDSFMRRMKRERTLKSKTNSAVTI